MSDKVIHERILNISGFQNVEGEIQRIIQEEEFYKIKYVSIQGNILKITFEQVPNGKKHPSFVKQVSKKKYASWEKFVYAQYTVYSKFSRIGELEFKDKWILFFDK